MPYASSIENQSPNPRSTPGQVFRSCPVCGSTEERPCLQKGTINIVQCCRCSMQYTNPVPVEFATGEYYNREGAEYYLSPAKLESDYSPVRFERELRLFRTYCQQGDVLDVGCSSGAFLSQLNQRFPGTYRIFGTDVSGPPLDHAESKGVTVLRGDFIAEMFGNRCFDAITLWAVAEHLLEPARFLEKAHTLLRPQGVCFVLVPNMRSFAVRVLGWRYRYIYAQHLNYFTSRTLARLAEPWFAPVGLRYTHFNPLVIWQDWRRQGAEVSNAERGALLQRTTAYKKQNLMAPLRVAYRMAELVLRAFRMTDNVTVVLRPR